jgi:hypothetical protein
VAIDATTSKNGAVVANKIFNGLEGRPSQASAAPWDPSHEEGLSGLGAAES